MDIRIIASANQDLEHKIKDRTFREDLFYRLNVASIRTPSLQEMREDIPLLVNHFTRMACCELEISPKRFGIKALEMCKGRAWPGNARELQNFVRRAVMFCPESVIRAEDVQALEDPSGGLIRSDCPVEELEPEDLEPYKDAKEQMVNRFTLTYVSDLLERTAGNVTRAAELSGLSRAALQKIMRRPGVRSGLYRDED